MKDIYSGANSEYMKMTENWHAEDSPWKAMQIFKILQKNKITPSSIAEVGCGVGEILQTLNNLNKDPSIQYEGYDIAPDAIDLASQQDKPNIKFYCDDFTTLNKRFDMLLMIDVFEHVPDYIGFIEKCNNKADYKIFHIPLALHLSGIMRNLLISSRKSVGHLHYFSKETALATLEDTGLEIIDYMYTDGSEISKRFRTKIANMPRKIMFPFIPDLTARLIGGYSLLVIAK